MFLTISTKMSKGNMISQKIMLNIKPAAEVAETWNDPEKELLEIKKLSDRGVSKS